MIERLHEHIVDELKTNTKTDTIFILTSIFLNFTALGINSIVAADGSGPSDIIIFILFIVLVCVINTIGITGLNRGKQTRYKLLNGLLKMYKDQDVEGYYDPSILITYNMRYTLFTIAVVSTGVIAITVPLVLMIL